MATHYIESNIKLNESHLNDIANEHEASWKNWEDNICAAQQQMVKYFGIINTQSKWRKQLNRRYSAGSNHL